jgi:excisionase family DNA binding protein
MFDQTQENLDLSVGLTPTLANKLLTVDEVAERLRLTIPRVYELARRKQIPCVRIGRQVRFDESQLRAWIEQGGSDLTGNA